MESLNVCNQSADEGAVASSSQQRSSSSGPQPLRQRRPANGFLGFCHVHRIIVSRKNKKIENRLVTKILGNWWATLTDEQKAPYEERAREFKESFLAANPGFKWYTPRESTGNTPVTRQSNRRGRKLESSALASGSSAITPGKLADESQMGGLSSLMLQTAEPSKKRTYEMSYIANEHDYLSMKPPIVNNNTIMAGDKLPCADGGCNYSIDEDDEDEVDAGRDIDVLIPHGEPDNLKPVGNKPKTAENSDRETAGPSSEVTSSSAKKRKATKPKKNGTVSQPANNKLPHNLSFKDFMKVCPVYQYDVFLQKKAEFNKNVKKAMAKRRKRQALAQKRNASSDSTTDGSVDPIGLRRRRKGRSVRMSNVKTNTKASTTIQTNAADSTSDIMTAPDSTTMSSPPLRTGLELLLTAASTLERC